MRQVEYSVSTVTVDSHPTPTGRWSGVFLPEHPAAGGLIMPDGVCNNPRFRILAIENDVWHTEDTGVRTLEWCGPDEQAVRDLAVRCLSGRIVVRRHGPTVTIAKSDSVLTLGPVKPRVLYA